MGQDVLSYGESAREVPPLEKLSDGITALTQIALKIEDPLVDHLVSALRLRVQQLQETAVPYSKALTPLDRTHSIRPFRVPKTPAELAAGLAGVVANNERPLPEDIVQRFRLWSERMGVHVQSHQERVAAVLERYLPLADTLAETQADGKSTRECQARRDKARNVAAVTVWYYDPSSGELETLLRRNIIRGFANYERYGAKRFPQLREHGGSQVGVRDVQNNDPPLPVPAIFSTDQLKALFQWAYDRGINTATPYSIRGRIAQRFFSLVFTYADGKNPGQPLSQDLKTASYDSLMRYVNAFDPSTHGDDFAAYALPLVFAEVDHTWDAMQRSNASDGKSLTQSTNANLQNSSIGSPVEAPVPERGTTPVPSDSIVGQEAASDDVPQEMEPNIATTETHTTDAAAARTLHYNDQAHVACTVRPETLSRLQQKKDAAAARRHYAPGADSARATSSTTAMEAVRAEDVVLDAAALEECNRQEAVMDYVRKQEKNGAHVLSYLEALALIIENNRKTARTDARKALVALGVKHPKAATVQAAADTILSNVAATFAPPDSTQQYFRGYLSGAIKEGIKAEYDTHV